MMNFKENNTKEIDPFARKLNSPFYRFFDCLAQYLLLNFSMMAVCIFSFGLLSYFSLHASAKIFTLDKEDLQSISWAKKYFAELKKSFKDKDLYTETLVYIFEFLLMFMNIVFIYDNASDQVLMVTFTIGLVAFLFYISQTFYAGSLRLYYRQRSIARNILLYFVFMMKQFLASLMLIVTSIFIFLSSYFISPTILFFSWPIIPWLSAKIVKNYRNKQSIKY